MADGSFDDLLLGLAQRHKGIEDLLYSILSFFERRTDLFHIMENPNEKMGFMPGVAEKMMQKHFRFFQHRYLARAQPHMLRQPEGEPSAGADGNAITDAPVASAAEGAAASASAARATPAASAAPAASSSAERAPPAPAKMQPLPDGVNASPEEGGDPAVASRFKHINTFNGACNSKYRWAQQISETTVEIEVEKCSAKDIKVDLTPTRVTVWVKKKKVIEGKLHEKINQEESLWNLEDGINLILHLEKVRQTWWKCVLEGDEEIDTTKVESVRHMDEYDGETQGAIRKIMFDQTQKAQGKATSDQLRTADIMKDAWNAPGSPFRGTEFDPTLLNLSGPVGEEFFGDVETRRLEESKVQLAASKTNSEDTAASSS